MTTEIATALQVKFNFDFQTATERDRWVRGPMTRALKGMCKKGRIERLHDPVTNTGGVGRSRLRKGTPQANARGVENF